MFCCSFWSLDSLLVHFLEFLVEFVRPRPGKTLAPVAVSMASGRLRRVSASAESSRGDLVSSDQSEKPMLYRGRLACDGQSLADRFEDRLRRLSVCA